MPDEPQPSIKTASPAPDTSTTDQRPQVVTITDEENRRLRPP